MNTGGTWVISGASRGIGAELAEQVLQTTDSTVIATGRNFEKAKRLVELRQTFPARLYLILLDVLSDSSIQAAVEEVSGVTGKSGVDYLINNAGFAPPAVPTSQETMENFRTTVETNVVGVQAVTQAFLPLLKIGSKKVVINMSSCLGSHGFLLSNPEGWENSSHRLGSYKSSKAALNMLTLSWAADVTPEQGFTFVAVHPGVVTTDMGSGFIKFAKMDSHPAIQAIVLTPAQSVNALLKIIANLKPEDSGNFLDYNGVPLPY